MLLYAYVHVHMHMYAFICISMYTPFQLMLVTSNGNDTKPYSRNMISFNFFIKNP